MKKFIQGLLFVLFLSIAACTDTKSASDIVTFKIKQQYVLQDLPKALEKQKIWYQLVGNRFAIHKKDKHVVSQLVNEVLEKYIPKNRSFTGFNSTQTKCYIRELSKNDVKFTTRNFEDRLWIVLDKGTTEDFLFMRSTCAHETQITE